MRESKSSMWVSIIIEPRYGVTFLLSTVCGWIAGIFSEGKALLGEQNLMVSLNMVPFLWGYKRFRKITLIRRNDCC